MLENITLNESNVTASIDAYIHHCLFGYNGVFKCGQQLKCEIINNNLLKIYDGLFINQGRFYRIAPGSYEEIKLENGVVEITDKTLENVYALARALMKKYNIDIDHVYRHYDVNGKLCPNCNGLLDDNVWKNFKNNIVNSTVGNLGTSTATPSAAKNDNLDSIISRGQQHSINFTGHSIATDGAYGPKTRANIARCFQHAINLDYGKNLKVDGAFGKNSKSALGKHYVKRKETQYLVTAVEIALMCRGYNPSGVECPGKFGSGLEAAVKQFQSDRGLKVDGIAGRNTILKLIGC